MTSKQQTAFDPMAEAEAYAESWAYPGSPTTVRFGWLGEDGDYAYALGHDVPEDDFAAALDLDGDDWNFRIGYMTVTEHPQNCERCAKGYCDGGWEARFFENEVEGAIAVTWWSA